MNKPQAPNTIPAPLPVGAIAPLDAIQRVMTQTNARSVAITTPRAEIATDAVCAMLSRNIADSDTRTILIDISTSGPSTTNRPSSSTPWSPSDPIPEAAIDENYAGTGYDRFLVQTTSATRPLFNNLARLQKTLQQDLRSYGAIVIHLPPILDADASVANPVSIARAVDTTFLVCATGRTNIGDAQRAVELLKNADVNLGGTIIDNTNLHPPGQDIADRIDKLWLVPGFLRRPLSNFLRKSELFN